MILQLKKTYTVYYFVVQYKVYTFTVYFVLVQKQIIKNKILFEICRDYSKAICGA